MALRNDAPSREQEGLDLRVVLGSGHVPDEITFLLHDLSLRADLWDGQKTGLFSEQRENDRFLAPPAPDARVLDAFCYSGAWGLHASRWGPSEVVFLDASEEAFALARIDASANGATPASFVRADVLDFVCAEATASGFDLVILDPPAFAEFHRLVPQVLKGYLNLDKRGFAACSLVGTW